MIIHLINTCSAFAYGPKLIVSDYKIDPSSKANAIIVTYNDKQLTIPWANIVAIEEQ